MDELDSHFGLHVPKTKLKVWPFRPQILGRHDEQGLQFVAAQGLAQEVVGGLLNQGRFARGQNAGKEEPCMTRNPASPLAKMPGNTTIEPKSTRSGLMRPSSEGPRPVLPMEIVKSCLMLPTERAFLWSLVMLFHLFWRRIPRAQDQQMFRVGVGDALDFRFDGMPSCGEGPVGDLANACIQHVLPLCKSDDPGFETQDVVKGMHRCPRCRGVKSTVALTNHRTNDTGRVVAGGVFELNSRINDASSNASCEVRGMSLSHTNKSMPSPVNPSTPGKGRMPPRYEDCSDGAGLGVVPQSC